MNYSHKQNNDISVAENRKLLLQLLQEKVRQSHLFPLSFAQQRLWFIYQMEPESPAYNITTPVRLTGWLNITALEQSLNEIVRRHEALRTTFVLVNGQPFQRISLTLNLTLPLINLQQLPPEERNAEALRIAMTEAQQPFNLERGALLRCSLLQLKQAEYWLLFTTHHIISDGWSIGVLTRELTTLYEAFCLGQPSPLPELPIQYADFAIWQRQYFQEEVLQNLLSYWKQQLKNLPILKLPTDYPRPDIATYRGAKQSLTLSKTLFAGITTLSLQEETTVFMTLLAVFKVVMHYYSGQEDIVVGTDVANRNRAETEGLIGFFVNQLVLRTSVAINPSFSELLQRVKEVTLGAYSHQDLPFDVLVNTLNPERKLNLSPLFQVKFILDNTQAPKLETADLTIHPIEINNNATQLDLILRLTETSQSMLAELEYNTDIFTSVTVAQIIRHWEIVLMQVVTKPNTRLQELVDAIAAADAHDKSLTKIKHKQDIQQKIKTIKRKAITS